MTLDDQSLQDILDALRLCVGDRLVDAHEVAGRLEALVLEVDAAHARVLAQAGAMAHACAEGDLEIDAAVEGVWRLLQTIAPGRLAMPSLHSGTDAAEASAPESESAEARQEVEEEAAAPEGDSTEAEEETEAKAAPVEHATPEMPPFVVVREERDLVVECAEECVENTGVAENAILELESRPDSDELVNTVFRSFHTIKGIAGFLDLGPVSHLAHRAESLLAKVRSKDLVLNQTHCTALLESVDCLGKMLADLQRGEGPDDGIRIDVPSNWAAVYESLNWETSHSGSVPPNAPAAPEPDAATASPEERHEIDLAPPATVEPQAVASAEEVPPLSEEQPASETAQVSEPKDAAPNNAKKSPVPPTPAVSKSPSAAKTDTKSATKSSSEAFVRVRTDRLDQLLDAVGELVIAQTMVADRSATIDVDNPQFAETISQTGKIVRELQDLAMSLRMVPMASTFQRMSRVARDVAAKCKRKVRMQTMGEDTEIDRNLVSLLSEPLIHMIRNAVDHGIEPADVRRAAGKDPVGTVTLSATAEAGRIAVRIRDDGAGINAEKLMAKARKLGILGPEERISDSEAYRLIFHAGFSMAEKVTDTSGRGVGMDVVRRNVELLGGRIHVDSVLGEGTTFSIYVPLTLAITDGMIVGVADERYILPTLNIVMSFQPTADILARVPGCGEVVLVRGTPIPVVRLHEIFGIDGACTTPTKALLVLMADGDRRFALLVDEVVGQHQVVTKALDVGAQSIPGLGGAAILGDGRVGLIVDPGGMAQRVHRRLTTDSEQVPSLH